MSPAADGALLRELRIAAGLTQEELAELTGLSVRAISNIERGLTQRPRRSSLRLIEEAIGAVAAGHPGPAGPGTPPPDASGPLARPRPAQLPADTVSFTGRSSAVDELCVWLDPPAGEPGMPVCAIVGMGGVGKTTLAVHVSHRLRSRFPDGQLYVDLHGAATPTAPAEVLARFLRDLGADDAAVPADEQERGALYRSLLHGRAVLVVLDNAASAAQVEPLLPGGPGCAVLVTSRTDLSALPGAHRVELESMPVDEADALLAALVGDRWRAADAVDTQAVRKACGGLPLAIHIAGRRLASRPNWSVRTLADRLADQRHRLDELRVGDLAVRASFLVSYEAAGRDADAPGRRLFRRLGLAGGATMRLAAVAALVGEPVDVVERDLESLVDAHLVESPQPARYRQHDLLAVYAAERAEAEEPAEERDTALRRLLVWYAHSTQRTASHINPVRRHVPLPPLDPDLAIEEFADYATALRWLDDEYDTLRALPRMAVRHGWHDLAWQLPMTMWDVFHLRVRREDAVAAMEVAADSARRVGDPAIEAWVLNNLGAAYLTAGQHIEAIRTLREALPPARMLGDRGLEGSLLGNIGLCHETLEEYDAAAENVAAALAVFVADGVPTMAGNCHVSLGSIAYLAGEPERALEHYREALAIGDAADNDYLRARGLDGLSEVLREFGRLDEAAGCARQSIALSRRVGNRAGEANALINLADALAGTGELDEARTHWQAAQAIIAEVPQLDVVRQRDDIAARRPELATGRPIAASPP